MAGYAARDHHGILTTPEALAYSSEHWPDLVALRAWRDETYLEITFSELTALVDRLAAGLIRRGVRPGTFVALLGENRPEWSISYLAIHRAGATVVPLDSLLTPGEIAPLLADSGAHAIIVSDRFLADVLHIREDIEDLDTIICMAKTRELGVQSIDEVSTDDLPAEFPAVTLDDLAALIYTSGTTGKPKGVMLTQRNIMSDVALSGQILILGPGDNFLSVLPLHHTFECTAGFLVPLYWGASITYARSLKSRDIIEDARNTGATFLLGVPLLFEKMMQGIQRKLGQLPVPKRALIATLFGMEKAGSAVGLKLGHALFSSLREGAGLGTLRILIAGGAALPAHVGSWFNRLGFNLFQGYGLTESSPIISVPPADLDNVNTVGPPIPGVEARIDNPNADGHGEICVRGPIVMRGYFRNQEATDEVIDIDGWLHTGDIGYMDGDGLLYITGRMKNVLVTPNGKNVYPEEVEHIINQEETVLESMVYGVPVDGGEEIRAYVVPDTEHFEERFTNGHPRMNTEDMEKAVLSAVHAALTKAAEYKRPRRIEVRHEEFEKTSTRKIKRYLYKDSGERAT